MKRSTLIARQGRRPSGLLGEIVARIMARETHAANLVALDMLNLVSADRVLEVGFGHGRTLAAAAEIVTRGRLAGVDPSRVMMGVARRRNAAALRSGKMDLHLGTSERLPFDAGAFNKVYAVHTIYFWAEPARDLAEMRRVLAPGGRLLLGFRSSEDAGFVRDFPPEIYHIRSAAEVEDAVRRAGFSDVRLTPVQLGVSTIWFVTGSN